MKQLAQDIKVISIMFAIMGYTTIGTFFYPILLEIAFIISTIIGTLTLLLTIVKSI